MLLIVQIKPYEKEDAAVETENILRQATTDQRLRRLNNILKFQKFSQYKIMNDIQIQVENYLFFL